MKGQFSAILLALFGVALAEGFSGRLQHHHHHHPKQLKCWATNGWEGDDDKDTWCTENCLNPGAPSCPPTTGDGGGCDCNCKHEDDDCPGE